MKKTLASLLAAACLLTGTVAMTGCSNTNAEAQQDMLVLTELKVGKYYLEGGTDEQYIEVYDDKTICLFGYEDDADALDIQKEETKRFTTRKYYTLSDVLHFIGVSDEPHDTISPENGNMVGYGYEGSEVITFTAVINGVHTPQKYIYRAE